MTVYRPTSPIYKSTLNVVVVWILITVRRMFSNDVILGAAERVENYSGHWMAGVPDLIE